jgi:hypothetical protein
MIRTFPVRRGFNQAARALLATCLGACVLSVSPAAAAETTSGTDNDFFGLLRVRDLTPFGFRRLDMRQSAAAFAPPDGPSVEFDLGYQNTWSLSSNVDHYLRARTQRGPLTQADAAAIRALGGENYLVDLELALFDIAFNFRLSDRVGVFAVLSGASYTGGVLDGFVEGFHDVFGFGSAARPGLDRNQINVLLDLKGQQVTLLDAPANSGVLDPVFGLRYTVSRDPTVANLVFETAVKVPLGRGEGLYSTNRADVGVQITAQAFHRRNAWYASAAMVYFSGSAGPFDSQALLIPTAIIGYEYRWLERTNLIAQAYASRSTFSARQTDLAELRGNKFQASLGVRHHLPHGFWSFAFTENLRNFNNTPDIGFQFGMGYTFR